MTDGERERIADALEDGDVVITTGTARAALRHRDFRLFWSGLFASNIGTWMQNIIAGAYILEITHDATWVGLLAFAQLGPLIFLSPISGAIADTVDRRRYLVAMQSAQLVGSLVLAVIALGDNPSPWALFGCMAAIGVANALGGPGMSAISPSLVPKEDLPGAISLFSFQMNMSRVVGPVIGQMLYSGIGASAVFAVNSLTYLFAIYGLTAAKYPRRAGGSRSGGVAEQLASGFKIAWNDPLIRRIMFILWTMSLISLNFISFMPKQATVNLHINPKTQPYGVLYGSFGLGAAAGAMSVGSIFARRDKAALIRPALVAFGVFLTVFALLRTGLPAYPTALFLGYAYFVVVTSLSTVLQAHIPNEIRGRIMALWIMGFGGAVGIAALLLGPLAQRNVGGLLLGGALWLFVLALIADPAKLRPKEMQHA